jgi:hypothetical protein
MDSICRAQKGHHAQCLHTVVNASSTMQNKTHIIRTVPLQTAELLRNSSDHEHRFPNHIDVNIAYLSYNTITNTPYSPHFSQS